MSVKINASTTSGLVVDSDLTGSLKLQTGGNDALTVDSSQVVNFTKQYQIGGVLPPAFSANGTTSIASSTLTTLTFATEIFDTNNNFASNTFTPTVAGYYQINFGMSYASAPAGQAYCQLRKNGIFYSNAVQSSGGYLNSHTGSVLVYMNGTTDYLTVVCAQFGGTTISADTVINGCLMRTA